MMPARDDRAGAAPDRFETQRLKARRISSRDRPHYLRLYTDRDVARTLGGVRTVDWIAERHEQAIAHWERLGFGEYLLFDRVTSEFVGRVLLRELKVGDTSHIELGYAFLPQYWNRGFGTEAAEALISMGFATLGLDEIIAFTLPVNRASCRIMEKIGMSYWQEAVHEGEPHIFYRITR